jgi:hypothetical protein
MISALVHEEWGVWGWLMCAGLFWSQKHTMVWLARANDRNDVLRNRYLSSQAELGKVRREYDAFVAKLKTTVERKRDAS